MNTQEKLSKVIEIANEKYDGHFTLMKFTTNWRVIFGTINERDEIKYMNKGNTIDEVLDKAIENSVGIYDFSKDELDEFLATLSTQEKGV